MLEKDSQTKKETLVGILIAVGSVGGLIWVLTRFIDSGLSVVTSITLVLILLIVFKHRLLPKKYRDALKKLDK